MVLNFIMHVIKILQSERLIKKRKCLRSDPWHTPVCGGKTDENTAKEAIGWV